MWRNEAVLHQKRDPRCYCDKPSDAAGWLQQYSTQQGTLCPAVKLCPTAGAERLEGGLFAGIHVAYSPSDIGGSGWRHQQGHA